MIRKITMLNPRSMSWEFNEYKQMKPADILDNARKEFDENRDYFEKASLLMSHLKSIPTDSVEKAIQCYFGNVKISITKKSKISRVYSIYGGLYIHEEDVPQKSQLDKFIENIFLPQK